MQRKKLLHWMLATDNALFVAFQVARKIASCIYFQQFAKNPANIVARASDPIHVSVYEDGLGRIVVKVRLKATLRKNLHISRNIS